MGNVHVYKDRFEAMKEFYANTPMSILGIAEEKIGILFYEGGCNCGVIKYLELEKGGEFYTLWIEILDVEANKTGARFSNIGNRRLCHFVAQKGQKKRKKGQPWGEYMIVSKEWSPAMLEHYMYSLVGMTRLKEEEHKEGDGWV